MELYTNAERILEKQVQEVDLPFKLMELLKQLTHARRGWLKRNVHEGGTVENALQHTAKLALAAASIVRPEKWGIDSQTLRQQTIIHELPEIKGKDWTPGEIGEKAKLALETAQLEAVLPKNFPRRREIIELWQMYEQKGLAYYLDKMDAAITAEYYALVNPKFVPVADEFHTYAQGVVKDPVLRAVMSEVRGQVRKHEQNGVHREDVFPIYFGLLKDCSN